MSLERAVPEDRIPILRLRLAWFCWFAVIAIIMTRSALVPYKNNCFLDHYRSGGLNWYEGNDLYQSMADTCRYSPLVHAFLVPFSVLSDRWGSIAWHLVEGIAFLAAFSWWLRAVCPTMLSKVERSWIVVLAIPLAIGSLNNGQSNVFMIAGLLAGMAAVSEKRWFVAALAIAFASFFKIYPLALAMILLAMYPRQFGWRFLVAIAAGLLFPFFLQNPEYVARQYERWLGNLKGDDRSNWEVSEGYRDVWMLIRTTGTPNSFAAYRVIQLAVGGAIGLLCIWMRFRGDGGRELLNRVLGLACCWMTAFGPATESPTYILLTATLAWMLLQSWKVGPRWMRLPLMLSACLFFVTVIAITTPYGRQVLILGTQPIGALLILGTLTAVSLLHPVRESEAKPAALPFDSLEPRGQAA